MLIKIDIAKIVSDFNLVAKKYIQFLNFEN